MFREEKSYMRLGLSLPMKRHFVAKVARLQLAGGIGLAVRVRPVSIEGTRNSLVIVLSRCSTAGRHCHFSQVPVSRVMCKGTYPLRGVL